MTTPTTTTPQSLERRLGPLDAAAIIVANVIGGGILFFAAAHCRQRARTRGCFSATWLVGGALAFCGAMALRGARGAAAARGRRVCLPARGVRPPRRVPDRMDVVCRGLRRRHGGQRDGLRALSRSLHSRRRRLDAVLRRSRFRTCRSRSRGRRSSRSPRVWLFAFVHIRGVGPGRVVSNVLAMLKVDALLIFIALGL